MRHRSLRAWAVAPLACLAITGLAACDGNSPSAAAQPRFDCQTGYDTVTLGSQTGSKATYGPATLELLNSYNGSNQIGVTIVVKGGNFAPAGAYVDYAKGSRPDPGASHTIITTDPQDINQTFGPGGSMTFNNGAQPADHIESVRFCVLRAPTVQTNNA